jgi:hypothetical protein
MSRRTIPLAIRLRKKDRKLRGVHAGENNALVAALAAAKEKLLSDFQHNLSEIFSRQQKLISFTCFVGREYVAYDRM